MSMILALHLLCRQNFSATVSVLELNVTFFFSRGLLLLLLSLFWQEHLARVHFNQTFKFVNEWLRTTRPAAATSVKEIARGKGASLSSTWSPLSSATPAAAAAATAGTGDHNTASLSGFPSSETPPPRSATDATAAADSPVSPFRPRVKR